MRSEIFFSVPGKSRSTYIASKRRFTQFGVYITPASTRKNSMMSKRVE
jgi:hypothetical protein